MFRVGLAGDSDREAIYRLRHQVYAAELGQHLPNPAERLTDACDAINEYLVAWSGPAIPGFVSLTPPGGHYGVAALNDPVYYAGRYAETASLRSALSGALSHLLCHLPLAGPDAATVCVRCQEQGVFLRDAASISPRLGTHCLRVAVKDTPDNDRIVSVLTSVLSAA